MGQTNHLPPGRAALVIGHPGHELRVHHWLEQATPDVFVLTDGSGSRGEGRIASTTKILDQTDCRPASVFGKFTDQRIYDLVLARRVGAILELIDDLASEFETRRIDYVVGDACEGYNPTHDLCRMIIGAAVEIVRQRTGAAIGNYDFLLTGLPGDLAPSAGTIELELSDDAFERKLFAARGYAELADEVEKLDRNFGLDSFRRESLRPVEICCGLEEPFESPPSYERFGERRVAAGIYQTVLRFQNHMKPVGAEICDHVARRTRPLQAAA